MTDYERGFDAARALISEWLFQQARFTRGPEAFSLRRQAAAVSRMTVDALPGPRDQPEPESAIDWKCGLRTVQFPPGPGTPPPR